MKANLLQSSAKFLSGATIGLTVIFLMAGSQAASAQSNTFPSSGSAGIGTTTPSGTKLHVIYNVGNDATVVAEAGSAMSPALEFKDAAATPNRWRVGSGFNTTTDGLFFIYDKRQSAARMIIDTSGNVGIGTTSPELRLDARVANTTTDFTNNVTYAGAFGNVSGKRVTIGYDETGEDVGVIQSVHTGVGFKNLSLNPNGGNVGIGTANPTNPFTLNKPGAPIIGNWYNLGAFTEPTNNKGIHLGYDNSSQTGLIISGSNGPASNLAFWTWNGSDWGERMRVASSGNVGIGALSPNYKLDVQGGQVNASGGLCIAGVCKTDWSQVGGGSSQWTGTSTIYYNGGNVGIGTTSPSQPLHVQHAVDGVEARFGRTASVHVDISGNQVFALDGNGAGSPLYLNYSNGGNLITGSGNVGIGTPNPQYKLDVAGNINSNATITGINIVAKYQDVAEWVPSSEQIPTGTVVVLDTTKSNQVITSTEAYDTRVAGVVSAQPGIALGESGNGKVLVATTGRVLVKVDATNVPIHIGDLLVTSDVPGVAKKSEPVTLNGIQLHRPGTIIGKALEPIEQGSAKILVLLSLQ